MLQQHKHFNIFVEQSDLGPHNLLYIDCQNTMFNTKQVALLLLMKMLSIIKQRKYLIGGHVEKKVGPDMDPNCWAL